MNEIIKLKQKDNRIIQIQHYIGVEPKRGHLLLLHGMAEHYERYDWFASYLAEHGYDVYLYSHRGHGTKLPTSELGFFASDHGYQLVVDDAIDVLTLIRNRFNGQPLILMGHSMGSIITRNVIQKYHDLDGIIICGTANPPLLETNFGLFVSWALGYKRNPKKKDPLMDKLMFGSGPYKKFQSHTHMDWLCTDNNIIDEYLKDPYCGFICTKSFYHDLMMLTKNATTKSQILKTSKQIPILIISGEDDPVGGFGNDVRRLIRFYQNNGYQISSSLYPGLRHELLNEPSKEKITLDILNFLNQIAH